MWAILTTSPWSLRRLLISDELVNIITQYGLSADPRNLQDGCNMAHGWRLGSCSKFFHGFNHVGGSFNLFKGHHRVYPNNPIFSNLGLCAACWAYFMCHHELWPTSIAPNSSLDLAGQKRKIQHVSSDLFFKILLFQVAFLLFYHYHFSLLSSGWFVIAVCSSISIRGLVK